MARLASVAMLLYCLGVFLALALLALVLARLWGPKKAEDKGIRARV